MSVDIHDNQYKKLLERRLEYAAKILKAHRLLIMKLADKGLHPFIKNGWINMNRMFSTYGLLGVVEANKILRQVNKTDFDYIEDILKFVNDKAKEFSEKYNFIFNIEQIPGESMATRLAKVDQLLFGNPYNLDPLYANQNIPLWQDATIYEKMDADGKVAAAGGAGNGIIFDTIEIEKYDAGDVQVNATVLVHGFVRKDRLVNANDLTENPLIHVVNQ